MKIVEIFQDLKNLGKYAVFYKIESDDVTLYLTYVYFNEDRIERSNESRIERIHNQIAGSSSIGANWEKIDCEHFSYLQIIEMLKFHS